MSKKLPVPVKQGELLPPEPKFRPQKRDVDFTIEVFGWGDPGEDPESLPEPNESKRVEWKRKRLGR